MSNLIEVRLKEKTSHLVGYIGWARLADHLKLSGELKPGEIISNLVADEDGVKYYIIKDEIELQKEGKGVK